MRSAVLRPQKARARCPGFWELVCVNRLQTTPELAAELWRAYVAIFPFTSQTTRFELDRALCPAPTGVLEQRAQQLARLVNPHDLLAAANRLSPEGSKRRRADVIQFEEALLGHLSPDGTWR